MFAMLCPLIEVQVVRPDTVEHPPVVADAALLETDDDVEVMLTEAHENQFLVETNKVHPRVGQVKVVGTVKVI